MFRLLRPLDIYFRDGNGGYFAGFLRPWHTVMFWIGFLCDTSGTEAMRQIVGRFERGSNVGDIVGSGLGLTIADEVARAHGGKLEISANTGGTGACVTVTLPRS